MSAMSQAACHQPFTAFTSRHAPLQPRDHRAQVAAVLGAEPHVRRAPAAQGREAVRPGHVPLPQRRRAARRASRRATRPPTSSAAIERMRGKSVLHPMGWDAFGLPAEQHAIKTGTPPRITTEKNIANVPPAGEDARLQLRLGPRAGHDRRRLFPLDAVDLPAAVRHLVRRRRSSAAGRSPSCRFPPTSQPQGDEAVRRYQDEHRLAYQLEAPVNWCPALGTVLANEEVIDGKSERGGHPVVRMPLRQWMLRITAYAERLENDLDGLDWSESIKALQRNWIGRSTGAEVDFFIGARSRPGWQAVAAGVQSLAQRASQSGFPRKPADDVLRIYTTRPDTLFGATYMVIAPEHPFVERLTTPEQSGRGRGLLRPGRPQERPGPHRAGQGEDRRLHRLVRRQPGQRRADADLGRRLCADQLRHRRDHGRAGARHARLRIRQAVRAADRAGRRSGRRRRTSIATTVLAGKRVSSPAMASRSTPARTTACRPPSSSRRSPPTWPTRAWAAQAVNYKLRDWLFSRQHFWGEPFPILHELDADGQADRADARPSPADELPVDLPRADDFKPHGRPEPPLEKAPADWLYADDRRQALQARNEHHAAMGRLVLVLLAVSRPEERPGVHRSRRSNRPGCRSICTSAAPSTPCCTCSTPRFWHKVLFDRGHVSTPEPFQKLVNQGMILGEMEITGYQTADGNWVSAARVDTTPTSKPVVKATGEPVKAVARRARTGREARRGFRADGRSRRSGSKAGPTRCPRAAATWSIPTRWSREYGADALRLYEMFMGPLEATKPWSMDGVNGVRGFLDRVWRMIVDERSETLRAQRGRAGRRADRRAEPRAAPDDPGA